MRLIQTAGRAIRRDVAANELVTLSGVTLAALLLPEPTPTDVTNVNAFLDHYQDTEL